MYKQCTSAPCTVHSANYGIDAANTAHHMYLFKRVHDDDDAALGDGASYTNDLSLQLRSKVNEQAAYVQFAWQRHALLEHYEDRPIFFQRFL